MFNPWYSGDEVEVGPLGENNELTLNVPDFLNYTNLIKSQKRGRVTTIRSTSDVNKENTTSINPLPNYMLNEFLIGGTRLNYFDSRHYIGVASRQYASPTVLQSLERMVIHPDIGFYFTSANKDGNSTAHGSQTSAQSTIR